MSEDEISKEKKVDWEQCKERKILGTTAVKGYEREGDMRKETQKKLATLWEENW